MATVFKSFITQVIKPGYFYIKPLLPRKGKLLLAADPKAFKSMLALNIAYSLCEGSLVMDTFPVSGPKRVLLIEQEVGPERLIKRLTDIHGARKGLRVLDNFWITSRDLDCRLDTKAGRGLIASHIEEAKPHVVIFDPLANFHHIDENSNSEMKVLLAELTQMQETYDFASIIIHHMGKTSEHRTLSSPERLRGAGVLFADVDTLAVIWKPDFRQRNNISLRFATRSPIDQDFLKLEFQEKEGTFKRV